jgi:general secretion pathway protein G
MKSIRKVSKKTTRKSNRKTKKGFTLVEILIVVIILGILAAIVIPQFTNASENARESSLTSQLQTLRSQVELYKLEHRDQYPTDDGTASGTWDWSKLTSRTDEDGTINATGGVRGPYLQQIPANSLNGNSDMQQVADDAAALALDPDDTAGFVFSEATGKIWATNKNTDGLFTSP